MPGLDFGGFVQGYVIEYPQNVHLAPLSNVAYYKAKLKSRGSEVSLIKGVQFENEKIVLKCVRV
jgi:hypothetical protein